MIENTFKQITQLERRNQQILTFPPAFVVADLAGVGESKEINSARQVIAELADPTNQWSFLQPWKKRRLKAKHGIDGGPNNDNNTVPAEINGMKFISNWKNMLTVFTGISINNLSISVGRGEVQANANDTLKFLQFNGIADIVEIIGGQDLVFTPGGKYIYDLVSRLGISRNLLSEDRQTAYILSAIEQGIYRSEAIAGDYNSILKTHDSSGMYLTPRFVNQVKAEAQCVDHNGALKFGLDINELGVNPEMYQTYCSACPLMNICGRAAINIHTAYEVTGIKQTAKAIEPLLSAIHKEVIWK